MERQNKQNSEKERKRQLEDQLSKEYNSDALEELESLMCIREWKCTDARKDTQFSIDKSGLQEVHFERRQFLKTHTKWKYLEKLKGTNISTFWTAFLNCLNNLIMAYLWGRSSITSHPILFIASVVFIGGSLQGMMGTIIHEAGHNLVSSHSCINKLTLFISNIPMMFPISFSFKRYHFLHHVYQGIEGKDPDLPLKFELKLIRGRWWSKALWISIYPIMYLIRGAAMRKEPSPMEYNNWVFTIMVDYFICKYLGINAAIYLIVSLWFGYSFHPIAAHFIQEHYTFLDGQETYSYYGPLNEFFLNIGYHNEHHDLTGVPWRRLPFISTLVPSLYHNPKMSHHVSWFKVHWDFITKENIGPCSRVTRPDNRKILKNE